MKFTDLTTGAMTDAQSNYGFGLTFQATGKAPIISHRIWDTLEHLKKYVAEPTQTAIAGLQLSVVEDTIADNNGEYFVKSVGTAAVLYADVDEYNTAKGTTLSAEQFAALTDAEKTKIAATTGEVLKIATTVDIEAATDFEAITEQQIIDEFNK